QLYQGAHLMLRASPITYAFGRSSRTVGRLEWGALPTGGNRPHLGRSGRGLPISKSCHFVASTRHCFGGQIGRWVRDTSYLDPFSRSGWFSISGSHALLLAPNIHSFN